MKDDKLVIGGHEFDSRFILGSGKYSLDLIKASVENAKAQIITLALRRANQDGRANILDRRGLHFCQIHRVREMPMKLFELPVYQENLVVETL